MHLHVLTYAYVCIHVLSVNANANTNLYPHRSVLFTIKLFRKCFESLCSLRTPYRLGLCVIRTTYRQHYKTLVHVVILSKHHHPHTLSGYWIV
jgi:hypothetical protein